MTEELYINGEAVDLKPDATTTLNYKSNLLGDISKITSSNSQTIQCPKTTRNRKIFDNPPMCPISDTTDIRPALFGMESRSSASDMPCYYLRLKPTKSRFIGA